MELNLAMRSAGDEPRVLVIEPNRNYLGVLARRLGDFGYRVATAETAQAGLAEMYRMPVSLVLCDVNLKGTNGVELARMIRDAGAVSSFKVYGSSPPFPGVICASSTKTSLHHSYTIRTFGWISLFSRISSAARCS